MNYLNRFKSKEHDSFYRQSQKLFLETRFLYGCVAAFYFASGGLYLMIISLGVQAGLISFGIIISLLLFFIILIWNLKRRVNQKKIIGMRRLQLFNDISLLVAIIGFMLANIIKVNPKYTDPTLMYHFGFWWGIFISLANLISSSWLIKWAQVTAGCIIIMLRYKESPEMNKMITGSVGLIFLSFLFFYIEDRFAKKAFLEKYYTKQQAISLRAIIGDLAEGILILKAKNEEILYSNGFVRDFEFWDPKLSLKENFKRLRLTRIVEHFPKTFMSGTFDMAEVARSYSPVKEMRLDVGNFSELLEKINSTIRLQNGRKHFLIDSKYEFDAAGTTHHSSYYIQLFTCNYNGEKAWAFIIRDTTERDTIITLRDNDEYKTRLLASVSHELRTPLNCSITFTEKALDDPNTSETVKNAYLKPALNSCKLLLNVINDILDFSQMKANKLRLIFEEKSIIDTVKDCVNLLSIQAEKKGIYLQTVGVDSLADPIVKTDHNRLRQIILNLLSNAMKFTYEGGITLILEQKIQTADERVFRTISMGVQDTGIGIKPEDQRKLFNAFEKIDLGELKAMNSTGVGLGLVISSDLARSLGPVNQERPIQIRSEYGVGTCFEFEVLDQKPLPGLDDSSLKIEVKGCQFDDSLNQLTVNEGDLNIEMSSYQKLRCNDAGSLLIKGRSELSTLKNMAQFKSAQCICPPVLIVDDDMFNLSALETILQGQRISSVSAFNGKIAIDKYLLRERTKCSPGCNPFSIMFMDCNMPIVDGYEASLRLKKMMAENEIRACPIIGCTALVTPAEIEHCKECGMDECISKPLDRLVLSSLLEKYGLTRP